MVQSAEPAMGNNAPSRQQAVSRHLGVPPCIIGQSRAQSGVWPLGRSVSWSWREAIRSRTRAIVGFGDRQAHKLTNVKIA
jgi:hypothetical protein